MRCQDHASPSNLRKKDLRGFAALMQLMHEGMHAFCF